MSDLNILDSDSKEDNNDSKFSSGEKKLIAGIAQWTKLIGVFSFIPFIYFAIDIFLGINLISSFSSVGILEIIFILVYLAICLVIISALINLIRFSNFAIHSISGHEKSFDIALKYLRNFFRVLGIVVIAGLFIFLLWLIFTFLR